MALPLRKYLFFAVSLNYYSLFHNSLPKSSVRVRRTLENYSII